MEEKEKKQITGLLGEMHLAMRLHKRGWQVYRAYIDSNVDFILTKYWCKNCQKYAEVEQRQKEGSTSASFPTDCCAECFKPTLIFVMRFVQVKTSEGIKRSQPDERSYSFHAKLRSNIDPRAFYAWIALVPTIDEILEPHFYIFHHSEINRFDNLKLESYQGTDNQKTTLHIDAEGRVLNRGRIHSYDCFNDDFHNNFKKLEKTTKLEYDV